MGTVRKWGNSDGVILNAFLMREAGISRGDVVEQKAVEGGIMIFKAAKKKLTLEERLAMCDLEAPAFSEEEAWGTTLEFVGKEKL
ncbi:antitoxin ChpS [Chimaeribacter arupi]|nr:antitoxin ChpS [Chimaeribacter arupi]